MQTLSSLKLELSRSLVLPPELHPRGQSHISAASGLVWSRGAAYVISDDELHLAVFQETSPAQMHRLLPGELPLATKARKKHKPDFEVLFAYDSHTLVAHGSGSKPNRNQGVVIGLEAQGGPKQDCLVIDLSPIYQVLVEQFGQINIEGAMRLASSEGSSAFEWVLLNRGVQGQSENLAIHYPGAVLDTLLQGMTPTAKQAKEFRAKPYALGEINNVMLSFTDACALPDGRWLYLAAAEDTSDSYLDGAVHGTVLGMVQGEQLLWQTTLQPALKFEGLSVDLSAYENAEGLKVYCVTDADDPRQPSQLWTGQANGLA